MSPDHDIRQKFYELASELKDGQRELANRIDLSIEKAPSLEDLKATWPEAVPTPDP